MHREMRTQDGGTIVISADITDLKDPQKEDPGGVILASAENAEGQRTAADRRNRRARADRRRQRGQRHDPQ